MTSTLRDFLFQADPSVVYAVTSANKAHSKVQNPKRPKFIRKWADFDSQTLNTMCNGIFKQALDQKFDFTKCSVHGNHIKQSLKIPANEEGLDNHLKESILKSVTCALQRTQQRFHDEGLLPQIPSPGISMVPKSEAESIVGEKTETGRIAIYAPDWAGCFVDSAEEQIRKAQLQGTVSVPQTHLPGDTKLRWKTNFGLLHKANRNKPAIRFDTLGLEDEDEKAKPPARTSNKEDEDDDSKFHTDYRGLRCAITQLYTYCYYANCRYGYIINETELLVLRIRPSSGPQSISDPDLDEELPSNGAFFEQALQNEGILEYRIIGFNPKDRTKLSVNLALWWLHLLAAIESDIRWSYPKLATLTLEDLSIESGYSRRDVSEEYVPPSESQLAEPSMEGRVVVKVRKERKRKQFSGRLSCHRPNPLTLQDQIPESNNEQAAAESDMSPSTARFLSQCQRILDNCQFVGEPGCDFDDLGDLEWLQHPSQYGGTLNAYDAGAGFDGDQLNQQFSWPYNQLVETIEASEGFDEVDLVPIKLPSLHDSENKDTTLLKKTWKKKDKYITGAEQASRADCRYGDRTKSTSPTLQACSNNRTLTRDAKCAGHYRLVQL